MEEGSKALKQGKENFYNNLATVLQEKHLMRRETNGRNKLNFKVGEKIFYNNLATVLQEKDLM